MAALSIAVIGPGRLGLRLARAVSTAGVACVAIRGRRMPGPDHLELLPPAVVWDTWDEPALWSADVLVIAVPDASIATVADGLAAGDLRGPVVLHTSGLLDSGALEPCRRTGAAVGSWHPLQSFPSPLTAPVRWDGVPCAIEGAPGAVDRGAELACLLGMTPWTIAREDKPRYHAAAAVASNLTHILVAHASRQLRRCGLPAPEGLLPLVTTSVESAVRSPDLSRLTGAISRGDRATVERHLEVLPEGIAAAYRALMRELEGRSGDGSELD